MAGTLVFFMGVRQVDTIDEQLLARGTPADADIIEGKLRELPELALGLPQPALVVVSEVVAVRGALAAPVAAAA
jgi:siroheme synthase